MAQRLDLLGKIRRYDKTPQGGIKAPSYLTRTGVFTYIVGDGKGGVREFRELRHPDEVFRDDSLATLAGAPVTRDHPSSPVTPATWRALAIGHVSDDVKRDGKFVASDVRVQDAAAIADVESETLVEFSCGYECEIDLTPGEYEGERYDGVQKNIKYNHVGMGPRGWGRAGADVRLRGDGGADIGINVTREDGNPETSLPSRMADPAVSEINSLLVAATARADAADATVKNERSRADKAEARADAAETKVKELETKASDDAIEARVATRVQLLDSARVVLGAAYKADGKSDRDVRIEAITKIDPAFKADKKSDDYVTAYFEAKCGDAKVATEALADVRADATSANGSPPKDTLAEATSRADKHVREGWRQPLSITRENVNG